MGTLRIGTSGWSYPAWHGPFYPERLARRRELEYASRQFPSLEINGSFYSLLKPETYRAWYEQTPSRFVFALKGSRFITHNKKLRDIDGALANFFASGILLLAEKLGPIVWQLPGNLKLREERLAAFLASLPKDTEAAARLAARHDARVEGRCHTRTDQKRRLRHALEVRHESFFAEAAVRLLRTHGVALVVSESADWRVAEEVTAGFVYLRLHGARQTYASRYSDRELDRWAARIALWQRGKEPEDARRITDRKPPRRKSRDVYVYFDNDYEAHAPRDARRLMKRLA